MANSKISALTSATTPLAGTETLPVVQSSATTKVTVDNLTAGRSVSGSNFVVTSSTIPANGVYLPAANSVGIATNSTLKATFDAAGNAGINVTPSAWGSAYRALNIASAGNGLAGATGGAQTFITAGAYFDGTNWKYAQNSFASYFQTSSGAFTWATAASGTAGNNITFTNAMTLNSSGNLGIGVTPSAWATITPALQLPNGNYIGSQGAIDTFYVGQNHFYDGTNFKYVINGYATQYQLGNNNGTHQWKIAPSGVAGNNITFTTAMTLNTSGNLGIGVTPAVKLDVLGTIQAAAAATQDAVRLAGRAGGTGTFAVTLTPTTLTASRTLTLPDATTTVVGTDATQTLTNKTLDSGILTGTLTAGGGVGTSGQFLQSTATGVQWAAATGVLAKSTSVFTSATAATYTAPANTQWVKITVVGFGGSGGGTTSQRGSGGGGGGVAIKWLAMTAGQTLIYTVGTAVTSTVVSGTLTITTISAGGGSAGSSTAYAANAQGGGAGGAASGGDININGGTGGTSYGSSTAVATQVSGVGGNCPGFGSGGTNTAAAISNGNNGNGYGAGGSGSIGNTSVGLGTGGVIIFEAF
jgi:hypothetical protein